ncbi:MAG TPA: hypothetical protein VFW44_08745 [Bryobacteraceae bacterium]|nr:hypothetical protein [Bryobacteraceae bacterium]
MKFIAIGLLLTGGMLVAQEVPASEQAVQTEQSPKQAHLSATQREALRTQSPPVKTHSRKHAYKHTKYNVTKNKTTIVATKPFNPDQK